jgi:hypothetical protein
MKIKTYTKKLKSLTKGYKVTPFDLDPADDLAELDDIADLKNWADDTVPRIKFNDIPNRREFMKVLANTGSLQTLKNIDIDSKKKEKNMFTVMSGSEKTPIVYVIQEISGTRYGAPKINIIGAQKYGKFVFCLPEMSQMIFSPGPLIFKLRDRLKKYTPNDYLLLTGDPAIIGVACSIVSDITNGKYNLLKWDKQERKYYPIEINLHERGNTNE